jgi:hypothetical protein
VLWGKRPSTLRGKDTNRNHKGCCWGGRVLSTFNFQSSGLNHILTDLLVKTKQTNTQSKRRDFCTCFPSYFNQSSCSMIGM